MLLFVWQCCALARSHVDRKQTEADIYDPVHDYQQCIFENSFLHGEQA